MADVKARLFIANEDIFYYPDVMVACDTRDTDPYFKRFLKVVVEVLSEATERTDRWEKFGSYIQIPTLEEYVLAAQDKMEVTIFRRVNAWKAEILQLPDQEAHLSSLSFKLSLRDIYEGVKFAVR